MKIFVHKNEIINDKHVIPSSEEYDLNTQFPCFYGYYISAKYGFKSYYLVGIKQNGYCEEFYFNTRDESATGIRFNVRTFENSEYSTINFKVGMLDLLAHEFFSDEYKMSKDTFIYKRKVFYELIGDRLKLKSIF